MRKYLIILLSISALFSCRRNYVEPADNNLMEVKVQASFDSLNNQGANIATRATNTTFQKGDMVGLYMVNFDAAGQRVPLAKTGNQESNVKYTSNDKGLLTTTPAVRYKKDYYGKLDLYAYYPYDAAMESKDILEYDFTVQTDQQRGTTTSDLCRAQTPAEGIVPSPSPVKLEFKHMLSKIEITLNLPRVYKEDMKIDTVLRFSFIEVLTSTKINIGTGVQANNTTKVPLLTPYMVQAGVVEDDESKSRPYKFEMIAPAQAFNEGKLFIEAMIRFENGKQERFSFKAIKGLFGDNSTKAGKLHQLLFSVDPGFQLSFKGIKITDWVDGPDYSGEVDAAITTKFTVSRQAFEPAFALADRVKVTTDDGSVYDIKTGIVASDASCQFSFTSASGAPRDYGFRIVALDFLSGNTSLYSRSFISKRVYDPMAMNLGALPFAGSGTSASPYLIATAADLDNIRLIQNTAGIYFKQTADIDLGPYLPIMRTASAVDGSSITFVANTTRLRPFLGNNVIGDASGNPIAGTDIQGGWIPVGHTSTGVGTPQDVNYFKGYYNGAGYTIENVLINRPGAADADAGVFGGVSGSGAKIANLATKNVYLATTTRAGAIAGTVTSSAEILNCEAQNGVVLSSNSGGVVGRTAASARVVGCGSGMTLYSAALSMGGVVGSNAATVQGCYNVGNVRASNNAGGICGEGVASSTLDYCYNRANVSGSAATSNGAIVGLKATAASNCYWLSTATYTNCGANGFGTSSTSAVATNFASLTTAIMTNRNGNDPTSLLARLNAGATKWVIAPAGHWNAGWPIPNPTQNF